MNLAVRKLLLTEVMYQKGMRYVLRLNGKNQYFTEKAMLELKTNINKAI